jgi:ubiquinone/menaquinone biosynthesis C-methylase UbiE
MIDRKRLSQILLQDTGLALVEPHIYSVYSQVENVNPYDRMGRIYDVVACNRFYNRFIWGYWPREYHDLCLDALRSSPDGWVLDAGCGSLAFTAGAYAQYSERPVILLDQSIKLLRMAKARMVKLHGSVPQNMVFVHADALDLPFQLKSFTTIISLNLLHALQDVRKLLAGLRNVLADGGTYSCTTLIQGNRTADRYLHMLGKIGALVPRSPDELVTLFDEAGMPCVLRIKGSLAFVSSRRASEQ